MTIDEFLEALEETLEDPAICKDLDAIPQEIRFKFQEEQVSHCPLTLVCAKRFDKHFDLGDYALAARELGVSMDDARKIIEAADDTTTLGDEEADNLRHQLQVLCHNVKEC